MLQYNFKVVLADLMIGKDIGAELRPGQRRVTLQKRKYLTIDLHITD